MALRMQSADGAVRVEVDGTISAELPHESIFTTLDEASVLLGQGGQQLASELTRTMQSGSTLTITTRTPGVLQAFAQLLGKTFKEIVIKDNVITAIRK